MVVSKNLRKWIHEDITNDAIFGDVIGRKENCLQLLRAILPQLNLQKIVKIQRQKTVSLKMLRKGTRFDVWATDDKGQNFDIEMQTSNNLGLLKRSMFYLGRMNDEQLMTGEDYENIKDSYVIFLCTFDPFGYNEAKNEVIQVLQNHRDKRLNSGQHIIFLNSTAIDKSSLMPDLSDFLNYMNGKINPNSSFIERLDKDKNQYINGKEWKNFMLDFKKFEEETKAEANIKGLKGLIATMRNYEATDEEILKNSNKIYGQDFSEEQLRKIIAETK